MKIFSWIHRHRFPYNVHPAEVSLAEDGSSVRRSGSSIRKANIEREPLLDEDAKCDWELDRILTIGTLAIDPLNLQYEDGDNGKVEDSYNYNDYHDDKTDMVLLKEDHKRDIEMCKLYVHKLRDVVKRCSHEIEEVEEEIVYEKLTQLERRVTLLDLFMADELGEKVAVKEGPPDGDVKDGDEVKEIKKKKLILYNKLPFALGGRKRFSSKAKKVFPATNGDVSPLKKLHRFMTRMMKKKIHPDMEARPQKKGQVRLNDDVPMGTNDGHGSTTGLYAAAEFASLLPTQGITV